MIERLVIAGALPPECVRLFQAVAAAGLARTESKPRGDVDDLVEFRVRRTTA